MLFPDLPGFCHRFCLYDPENKLQLTDLLEFHYLELPKFRKVQRVFEKPLEYWLYFLLHATELNSLSDLPEPIQKEEGIAMAYDAACELMGDQEFRYRLEARRKFIRDQATNLAGAKAEGQAIGEVIGQARGEAIGEVRGEARGEARGKALAIAGVVRTLVTNGREPLEVATLLGMSLEEVQRHLEESP